MIPLFLFLILHNIVKNLLQFQSSRTSVLFLSCFFKMQLSLPQRVIQNTVACIVLIFVGIDTSCLFSTMPATHFQ
uniref:Uncharacterized protein n=1 Tax=Naja naja TaxID=35670 RepID=A0A8C6YFW1_NAJNA